MEGLAGYGGNAVMEEGQRARYANDKKMLVRFYSKLALNKFKSNEEGRPIYDEKDYIRIMIPGDRNSIFDQPVKEEHKLRFPEMYQRFKSDMEEVESGTPLEEWPQASRSFAEEMKFFGIRTVEQLAELDDVHGSKIRGYHDIKRRAVAFLEAAGKEAENSKLASELEKRDVEIAALKEQMEQMIKATAPKGKAK